VRFKKKCHFVIIKYIQNYIHNVGIVNWSSWVYLKLYLIFQRQSKRVNLKEAHTQIKKWTYLLLPNISGRKI